MQILITGAAGFLGTRLTHALLSGTPGPPQVSSIIAADMAASRIDDPRVVCRTGTIIDPEFISTIVPDTVDIVYHLAAVLSGQSEDEFDLGLQVNVDATRTLLDACRRLPKAPRFVFASSLAVYGGELPDIVTEDVTPSPQSSYGVEKLIAELLVNEYSRRGFVDGVVCRLPTITVRPGRPNSAASSFVSGIIREPLNGVESTCPVPLDTRLWISSPEVAVNNLVRAGRLPISALEGRRTLNLPGLCVTPAQMLDALEQLGGPAARTRVRCTADRRIMRIVCSWPGAFDVSRALRLGFQADNDFESIVRQFLNDAVSPKAARSSGA